MDGARHKVFYFEAGEGIPVICQHTAGNENRQWRHLLEDRELTKKYKVIAYDFHRMVNLILLVTKICIQKTNYCVLDGLQNLLLIL